MTDVLYITGIGRSGSTALERYLASHERTVAVGEVTNFWLWGIDERTCSCGRPGTECPFWTPVRHDAFGETGVPDFAVASTIARYTNRTRYIPLLHRPTRRIARDLGVMQSRISGLYDAIGRAAPGRLVVDTSKYPSYAHLLALTPGVRAAFVHLVRDSRAVAYSFRRRRARPEIHWKHMEMTTQTSAKTAVVWDVRFAASAALRLYGAPVLQLRYEDFVADPQRAGELIARLLRDAGLPMLGPRGADADPAWYHSVQGNPMRFDREFVIRADDEWRGAMKPTTKLLVAALTAPLLAMHKARIGFA